MKITVITFTNRNVKFDIHQIDLGSAALGVILQNQDFPKSGFEATPSLGLARGGADVGLLNTSGKDRT